MKKKLLIVIPRMGGGGAERVVSIVANHLAATGYQVRLFTLVGGDSFYPLNSAVEQRTADFAVNRKNKLTRMVSLGLNFAGAIAHIRREIKEFQPDIVFSVLEEADLVTYLAQAGLHCTWLVSERNDPTRRAGWYTKLLNFIYRRSDGMVCQSRTVADYYAFVPRKWVVPNPIDRALYPAKAPEGQPLRIVSVGRLKPQKNTELQVEAFHTIADKYPNATFTAYGEGYVRDSLEVKIAQYGLENRFFLPGASRNVLEEIKDAALFVMSSDYEGFPNALVEAITIGIPVISTDFATGIARELITPDVGEVVPCGDARALAKAMDSLLGDPERRARIREVGSHATDPFQIENVVTLWEQVFTELTEVHHG